MPDKCQCEHSRHGDGCESAHRLRHISPSWVVCQKCAERDCMEVIAHQKRGEAWY